MSTRVEVLADHPVTKDEITTYLDQIGHPTADIVISGDTGNIAVMRYKEEFKQEEVNKFKAELAAEYGADPNLSTVSPTVGKELAKNAIKALLIAMLGIVIYVALRFEWRMGVATIVALSPRCVLYGSSNQSFAPRSRHHLHRRSVDDCWLLHQ